MDALDPNDRRTLYQEQIDMHWDRSMYRSVIVEEKRHRERLTRLAQAVRET